MSAKSSSARSSASKSRAKADRLATGERLVLAGVVVAGFGVAVAMLPGGYNPFGPIKALVLLCGCACVAIGFALQPALPASALRRAFAQRGAWPAFGLIGLACLATLTAIDPSQSLVGHYPEYQGLLLLLASALAALGAYSLAEKNATWQTIGRAAIVATLLVAAYAIAQFAGTDPVVYERVFVIRRVRSMLGNASNLGVFLCLALPLVVARARSERAVWRGVAWVAVIVGGVTLALALSRGAWAGAAVGAVVWLLAEGRTQDRSTRVRVATVALGVAVAVIAVTVMLVPNAAGRLGKVIDTTSGTAGWRVEVWSGASRLIAERPLLGFGPASFRYAFPPRRTAAMQAGEVGVQALDDPHNLFASAGVSAGVLAVAALLWLLGEALLGAWRIRRDDRWEFAGPALAASIAAGATALQFHFTTLDTAPLLAVLVALALGRTARAREPVPARALGAARVASGALAAVIADRGRARSRPGRRRPPGRARLCVGGRGIPVGGVAGGARHRRALRPLGTRDVVGTRARGNPSDVGSRRSLGVRGCEARPCLGAGPAAARSSRRPRSMPTRTSWPESPHAMRRTSRRPCRSSSARSPWTPRTATAGPRRAPRWPVWARRPRRPPRSRGPCGMLRTTRKRGPPSPSSTSSPA